MNRLFVPYPQHCGQLASYSFALCAWICAVCRTMLLTDEIAYRSVAP